MLCYVMLCYVTLSRFIGCRVLSFVFISCLLHWFLYLILSCLVCVGRVFFAFYDCIYMCCFGFLAILYVLVLSYFVVIVVVFDFELFCCVWFLFCFVLFVCFMCCVVLVCFVSLCVLF